MSFFKNISLVGQIIIGLVIGTLTGLFLPQFEILNLFGSSFIEALKAVAPALVMVLVISALVNASNSEGKRFRKIIALYLFSTLTAAVVSVFISFLFPVKVNFLQAASDSAPEGLKEVALALLNQLIDSPVNALLKANYIGILVWAVVFGIALKKHATESTKDFISQIAEALTTVVRWIISLAPIGIMGIVFTTVSQNGLKVFEDYGRLFVVLIGTMTFVALVVNPLIVFCLIRRNPYPLVFKCLKSSGITAFFTRSSAANIPVNMELCEELGLDKKVYSVSIPLGATVNMDGAAVTITVMTMAAVHTLGIEVSLSGAIMMSVLSALAACGTSGVAGGSILLIPLACSLFGISNDIAMQVVAIGFTIGVLQDSLETALNSSGDVLFVAASEFSDKIKRGEALPEL